MDTLKKPEMLVSGTSLAVTLAVAIYLSRRLAALEEQMETLAGNLATTVQAIGQDNGQGPTDQLIQVVRTINASLQEQSFTIEDITKVIESQTDAIEEIQDLLASDGKKTSTKVSRAFDDSRGYPPRRRRNRRRFGRPRVGFEDTLDLDESGDEVAREMEKVRRSRGQLS